MMHGQLMSGRLRGCNIPPKVARSFDGSISWFAFEGAIDDWLDNNVGPRQMGTELEGKTGRICQHIQASF